MGESGVFWDTGLHREASPSLVCARIRRRLVRPSFMEAHRLSYLTLRSVTVLSACVTLVAFIVVIGNDVIVRSCRMVAWVAGSRTTIRIRVPQLQRVHSWCILLGLGVTSPWLNLVW